VSECQVCEGPAVWAVAVAASEPWAHVVEGTACEDHVGQVERAGAVLGETVRLSLFPRGPWRVV
jgi:hypothetical protein